MTPARWLFVAVLAAAAPLPSQSAPDSLLQRTVWEREVAFAKTLADRDPTAFARFLDPAAVFFGGATPARGKEAVVARWARFFTGPDAPFSWQPDTVVVVATGDLAMSTGPVRDPTGKVIGRFNSVWRRQADGSWKVVIDKGS